MIRTIRSFLLTQTIWIFWAFLLATTAAEVLTALADPRFGMVLHMLLLVGLLAFATLVRHEAEHKLALALTLAPLIRLLSLALPLARFPQMTWYGMVAVPLFLAAWIITRETGTTRQALGLRAGPVSAELMLMLLGVGLGIVEYLILQPAATTLQPSLGYFLISALSLFLFTGFLEELIFRGLMQSLSLPVLGRWALIYVSLLFGALHIGHLSFVDVVFVSLIGLLFAYFVQWGRSILGVTLAHGLTNTTLFLVMPAVEQQFPGSTWQVAPYALVVSGMLGMGITFILYWRHVLERPSKVPASLSQNQLRALRHMLGLSYTELAQQTGLPVRMLIEAEHNPGRASPETIDTLMQHIHQRYAGQLSATV